MKSIAYKDLYNFRSYLKNLDKIILCYNLSLKKVDKWVYLLNYSY